MNLQKHVMTFFRTALATTFLSLNCLSLHCWAQQPDVSERGETSERGEASERGATSEHSKHFHADPSQLQFTRFSGDINVPDPVAVSFDHRGTAYVTQTQRRKVQDLDIRQNPDWVMFDVGFQSVDDKRDFFHQRLAPGRDQQRNRDRVPDLNGDGSHDWVDLTLISERIHWLRDEDGDGTADVGGVFAEDFRTEVTGIAAGVLWHDGIVYATVAPDVWKLRDTDGDMRADQREVIATGFGLHIAYAGHDMHGLTVGPDGKIYWSIGDKGISVTSPQGRRFHFPNQGGVMRCDPDGSNFEVFAHGLRNVQELAFDAQGNLFGVDNDADFPGEKERFVYIVRGMDAGWRCNYQYRGDGYNPWMDEQLWVPHFDGQASYILPPIENYVDGPAGFAFNPGTALSSDYLDHFFLTGAPDGYQYAFKVRPDGASFAMQGAHQIGSGLPIVGINFGPDGGLYGVDWGGGYPLTNTGAVWKIDVPHTDLAVQRSDVARRLRDGWSDASVDELVAQLSHADQRIRLGAQFELVARKSLTALVGCTRSDHESARLHAIWGLGQLARTQSARALETLSSLLQSEDAETRAQAARTLADVPRESQSVDGRWFVPLLDDAADRVRFMAMTALGEHPTSTATPKLLSISNELPSSKRYLRFAVSRALAACATGAELAAAREQSNKVGRLNLVVALRQKGDPQSLATFLSDDNADVATEAARALHDDLSHERNLAELAQTLNSTQHSGEAFLRRALNANYRRGGVIELGRVIDFVGNPSNAIALRLEGLSMIAAWKTPNPLDRVDGRRRIAGQRQFDVAIVATELSRLARSEEGTVQAAAVRAARETGIRLSPETLRRLVTNDDLQVELRIESLRSLQSESTTVFANTVQQALSDSNLELRIAAADLLVPLDLDWAEQRLVDIVDQSINLRERQNAITRLGQLAGDASAAKLTELLRQIAADALQPGLRLDVVEAAQARSDEAAIARGLGPANSKLVSLAADLPAEQRRFAICRDGGDPKAGAAVFKTHLSAQCARCHRVGNQGSDVGPNLKGIATKRDRDYLLRSIVAPSADIDEKYRTDSFLMLSGQVVQGLIKEQTESETVVVDGQGNEIRLDNDQIDVAKKNDVSIMPEMGSVLNRRQIRDLVAYLSTLK